MADRWCLAIVWFLSCTLDQQLRTHLLSSYNITEAHLGSSRSIDKYIQVRQKWRHYHKTMNLKGYSAILFVWKLISNSDLVKQTDICACTSFRYFLQDTYWWYEVLVKYFLSEHVYSLIHTMEHHIHQGCGLQLIFPWTKWPPFWQTKFSNEFSWMKMVEFRFEFHWTLCPMIQLTIFQHWFR